MRHLLVQRLGRTRSTRVALALGVTAVALLTAAGAHGRNTLTVCPAGPPECQYATVQEALTAASNGDRILIAPGSYGAGFTVGKSVSLIGSGESQTSLSGGQAAVTISAGVTVGILGLTISDAETGVVNLGTLTLRTSTIRDNGNGDVGVGGIINDGTLTLRDSAIIHNHGPQVAGIRNSGSATIVATVLDRNGAMGPANIENTGYLELRNSTVAGGVCEHACALFNQSGATALVINTVVSGNSSQSGTVTNDGILTIRGSTIRANEASFSAPGAIENSFSGVVTIKDTRITGNRNNFQVGPGAIGNDGRMTLEDTKVVGNGGGDGGGLHNRGTGILTLSSSTVRENTAETIGGGILNDGTAELKHSVVTRNIAIQGLDGHFGGGIYNSGTVTLRHSSVRGNIPDDCFGCP